MRLWDKGKDIDEEILSFTVGEDYLFDKKLLRYDCLASIAHAEALHKANILTKKEKDALVEGLNNIISLDEQGKFNISIDEEDCHTAIENFLIKEYGEIGKKIHTGRSRNDQVMAALKLYMKTELKNSKEITLALIETLDKYREIKVPLPGYTHMRKAMPSSIKLWVDGYIDSLKDDIILLDSALIFIDSNPLGSAAGYGTNLGIDREMISNSLGFKRNQAIAAVQISRGKNEGVVIFSLLNIMLDLGKLSTDIILFSMPEFGFFEIPEKFTTGSSIMPQKKNPDVLELIRAKAKVVQGNLNECIAIVNGLPSGFHRDFQLTKKPLIESIEITKSSLSVMVKILSNLKINEEKCKAAITPELFATDEAYELVKKGISFREAYKEIGKRFTNP